MLSLNLFSHHQTQLVWTVGTIYGPTCLQLVSKPWLPA